jgi:hypothetical protein
VLIFGLIDLFKSIIVLNKGEQINLTVFIEKELQVCFDKIFNFLDNVIIITQYLDDANIFIYSNIIKIICDNNIDFNEQNDFLYELYKSHSLLGNNVEIASLKNILNSYYDACKNELILNGDFSIVFKFRALMRRLIKLIDET